MRPNNGRPQNTRPLGPLNDSSPREWMRHLYSNQAGTSTPIRTLLQKLDGNGLGSDIVWNELGKYGDYELENYTFLQEIIPNLFLGRYRSQSMPRSYSAVIYFTVPYSTVLSFESPNPS